MKTFSTPLKKKIQNEIHIYQARIEKKILNYKSDFNLDVLLYFRMPIYSFSGHKLAVIKE